MKNLDSYLNDHLAGSISALELISHWAQLHEGKPLGAFFSDIETEVRADQKALRGLMDFLGIEESNLRKAGAWAAEKAGRARLMIAGNESGGLGLVLTLEGLVMGITGKKLMWRALDVANLPNKSKWDFEGLQRRAQDQIDRAEAERIKAAQRTFADANDKD